jgi:hypothetical protein
MTSIRQAYAALSISGLDQTAKSVVVALAIRGDQYKAQARVTLARLASDVGVSRATVWRAGQRAIAAGHISVLDSKRGKPTTYCVHVKVSHLGETSIGPNGAVVSSGRNDLFHLGETEMSHLGATQKESLDVLKEAGADGSIPAAVAGKPQRSGDNGVCESPPLPAPLQARVDAFMASRGIRAEPGGNGESAVVDTADSRPASKRRQSGHGG